MKIGNSIKEIRKRKGISQGELAEILKVSQTYLSQIEGDKKTPSMDLIKEISEVLGVPLYFVMFQALEIEKDIHPEKQEAYRKLSPAIGAMIEQFFMSKD